jgi:hypothetical protein
VFVQSHLFWRSLIASNDDEPYHTERNHQGKSTISLLQQIADARCEEAARSRERRGEPLRSYEQDAA